MRLVVGFAESVDDGRYTTGRQGASCITGLDGHTDCIVLKQRVYTSPHRCVSLRVSPRSLGDPSLDKPPTLSAMPSWSILTPLYEEDVMYALDAKATATALKLKVSFLPSSQSLTMLDVIGLWLVSGKGCARQVAFMPYASHTCLPVHAQWQVA